MSFYSILYCIQSSLFSSNNQNCCFLFRNPINGQMSIMVNKMADTPLPPAPAPPPPPPSLHNEWNPSSLYNGGGSGSVATDSIVDAGVPVVNMYNSNLHHHIQQQQQNQYEVCLLYTSPSPRDRQKSRMPSSA